jgi:hypothetical protein
MSQVVVCRANRFEDGAFDVAFAAMQHEGSHDKRDGQRHE